MFYKTNSFITKYIKKSVFILPVLIGCFLSACHPQFPSDAEYCSEKAPIFPDYESGIAIPANIAPLNFVLPDSIQKAFVQVSSSESTQIFRIKNSMRFSQKNWRKLLQKATQGTSDSLVIRIAVQSKSGIRQYPPLVWQVRPEPIDPYLTYRLVQPIDGAYHNLRLYERCIENFKVRVLISNDLMDNNCFNCHTYHQGDATKMTIHLRKPSEGTLFFNGNHASKIAVPITLPQDIPDSLQMPLNLVYPAWHPQEKYIAFSTNILGTGGYAEHRRFINLLDSASNLILYDIENNSLLLDKSLWTSDYEETWPAWSPDGKWLYFCRTEKPRKDTVAHYRNWSERVRHIHFDLCRIAFDTEKGKFADTVQVLLKAHAGNSYSVPRVHPDGKKILLCRALFNSVPYQAEGDLLLIDTADFFLNEPMSNAADIINSEEAESWHEWSHDGHWLIFSSKRIDGHYAFPHITYFDGENFSKPFLLPQRDGSYYQTVLRSFNLPTFTRNASPVTPRKAAVLRQKPAHPMSVEYR